MFNNANELTVISCDLKKDTGKEGVGSIFISKNKDCNWFWRKELGTKVNKISFGGHVAMLEDWQQNESV